MPRFVLTLTILILFLLEGTVLQLISPTAWGLSVVTVPRFALVSIIMVALFLGRREGLLYGMCFGFLQDVLYGQVIGVYTLSMMVAGYFAGLVLLLFHRSFAVVVATAAVILFGHEWLLYSLFRLFSGTAVDVQWMLTERILPSVGLNLVFALLIYVPMAKTCEAVLARKDRQHD
ncbi:rod shape-determining protein MreD [Brevibacillus sp. B_LB10_24]|uniref:rod shape-determining protein MreD n=1 Tax=Brevibacillus sp. B_LB10_24 TaxID=3380645 RepID=UPI0038BBE1F4